MTYAHTANHSEAAAYMHTPRIDVYIIDAFPQFRQWATLSMWRAETLAKGVPASRTESRRYVVCVAPTLSWRRQRAPWTDSFRIDGTLTSSRLTTSWCPRPAVPVRIAPVPRSAHRLPCPRAAVSSETTTCWLSRRPHEVPRLVSQLHLTTVIAVSGSVIASRVGVKWPSQMHSTCLCLHPSLLEHSISFVTLFLFLLLAVPMASSHFLLDHARHMGHVRTVKVLNTLTKALRELGCFKYLAIIMSNYTRLIVPVKKLQLPLWKTNELENVKVCSCADMPHHEGHFRTPCCYVRDCVRKHIFQTVYASHCLANGSLPLLGLLAARFEEWPQWAHPSGPLCGTIFF